MPLQLLTWFKSRLYFEQPIGQRGEKIAARYLKKQGYSVLARNLRLRYGEVDLLAETPDGKTVVIVEVKTSAGRSLPPEVRVGPAKQRKLAALATGIIRRYRLKNRPIRFDVIGIDLPENQAPVIRHYENAFESPW